MIVRPYSVGPDEFLPVPLSFGWIELDGKSEAALEADAGGPHLELRNLGDASVHVTVRALIDHGTTGGQELELADATLGPGKALTIAVPLDVGDKNVAEMAYAGQILPSVHAVFADGRTETVVGTPLFFHPGADAVRVYDRATLTTKYRWGDFHGDVDDALLVDTSLDAEEGGGFVTDRVVLIESISGPRVEPTDELEDDGA